GRLTSIRTLGGHRRYRQAEVLALLADSTQKRGK
ncbi:MerR family DNA-binding transcriptional regulator, partial [Streptosporangium sp. NPDC004631]